MATTLFDSNDWFVDEAPITGWGYNPKGTFYLKVQRVSPNGKPFGWTMNIPEFQLGNLPAILDQIAEPAKLRFTGGWQAGQASVKVMLAD